jgi:tagaturonate reductase
MGNGQFLPKHTERILQFGEGNFLRAFVDWKIQKLNQATSFKGSVVVIQPINQGLVNILNEQNGLYTLLLRGIENGKPKVYTELINSISRGINPYAENDAYLKTAEQKQIRFIVSNTTEAGICFDAADKFDDKPAKSFPGKLTQWLHHRYVSFNGDASKGIIFLPCELIEKNGTKLKAAVLQFIEHWNLEADFKTWVEIACTFCNTLVDRIVPGFPKETINEIYKDLGYEDKLVVEGEIFHFWVIEGPEWVKNELPFDETNLDVKFTNDLSNYRTRKVRILNGAHTTLVPVAYLSGIDTVRESVEHPIVGKYLENFLNNEIIPTLDLPYEELKQFADDVKNRFLNPFVKHFLSSIALNSISKFETRVLPSVLQFASKNGRLPQNLLFSMAALMHFYRGNSCGRQTPVNDSPEIMDFFKNLWAKYDSKAITMADVAKEILSQVSFWKQDLNQIPGFTSELQKQMEIIESKGVAAALAEMVK